MRILGWCLCSIALFLPSLALGAPKKKNAKKRNVQELSVSQLRSALKKVTLPKVKMSKPNNNNFRLRVFSFRSNKPRTDSDLRRETFRQLKQDKIPIPLQLGAVFVPRIVKKKGIERTFYAVFDKAGKQVGYSQTGKKILVFPGVYQVKVGTRNTDVLPAYKVRIKRQKIVIIYPQWSALIVRLTDERQIGFRGTYELIRLETRRGIGIGIGADESLGDKLRPWLLPPGLYMIVRVGDNYLARTNFLTVRLRRGEVVNFRLVMDRNTNNFLGGGVQLPNANQRVQGPWRWSLQLSGNFIWNQLENVPATIDSHSLSLTAFLFARISMNRKRHYFLTTLDTELGFTTFFQSSQGDSGEFNIDQRKGSDRLDLQSIYIYRLTPILGPYIRFGLRTSMLPNSYYFSENDPTTAVASSVYACSPLQKATDPNSCSLLQDYTPNELGEVQLSSPFDPLAMKQGLGFNIQAVRKAWLDLRVLFGVGLRQDVSFRSYQFDSANNIVTRRCKNESQRNAKDPADLSKCSNPADQEEYTSILLYNKKTFLLAGLELAIVATGRVSSFLSFAFELDALSQFGNFLDIDVDMRLNITLRLSQYANIIYSLRVRRDPTLDAAEEFKNWYFSQSVVLNFTIML